MIRPELNCKAISSALTASSPRVMWGSIPTLCAPSACSSPARRPSPARGGIPAPSSAWWSDSRSCTGCEYRAPLRPQSDPPASIDLGKNAMPPVSVDSISSARRAWRTSARLISSPNSKPIVVDHRPGELLHAADGLLQVQRRGVVLAVGDQNQHLLGPLGVGHQLVGRGHHRVVERRAAARLDVRSPSRSLLTFEVKSWSMKASSEKFTTKASSCGFEASIRSSALLFTEGRFFVHRSGVVDDQRDRNRQIGVLKADDVLLDAVFKNLKVILLQVLDQLRAVEHRGSSAPPLPHWSAARSLRPPCAEVPGPGRGRCSASGERTGSRSSVSEGACAARRGRRQSGFWRLLGAPAA